MSYSECFGDSEKLLMGSRFSELQPWWSPRSSTRLCPDVHCLVLFRLSAAQMGKIMAVCATASSPPHVFLHKCFKQVLVRNNFSLKMPWIEQWNRVAAVPPRTWWDMGLLRAKYEVRLSHSSENICQLQASKGNYYIGLKVSFSCINNALWIALSRYSCILCLTS